MGNNNRILAGYSMTFCGHHMILKWGYMHSLRTSCIAFRTVTQPLPAFAITIYNEVEIMCMSSLVSYNVLPTWKTHTQYPCLFSCFMSDRQKDTEVGYLMTLSNAKIMHHPWPINKWVYAGRTGGIILTSKNWSAQRKTCPTAPLSNANPTWTHTSYLQCSI